MSDIDEKEKLAKITKLLEKGGTMLATHHECGAPMFRVQGKTVCPICDFQEKKPEIKQEKTKIPQIQINSDTSEIQHVNKLVMNKILNIALSLENEADLQRLKVKMECIEQGVKILKLCSDI